MPSDPVPSDKICIIGGGASGIAVAKTFSERGIPFDCFEKEADIGGLWNISTGAGVVYETAHMLSSKEFTGFEDFPMPEDFPLYPSHAQALDYLKEYAAHFGVLKHIRLGCPVRRIESSGGHWRVRLEGERAARSYRGVVVASGHHAVPRWPDYPRTFSGEMIHSSDYKAPHQLAGRRVLVIGAGNSACDIAIDAMHHGKSSILSMRRGTYFVPKFMFGIPTDDVVDFAEKFRPPRWLKQRLYKIVHRVTVGSAWRYGLPEPQHRILDTHPTVNSEFPGHVAHGQIDVRPDVEGFDGNRVRFVDGSEAEVDMVVCATGYRMSFPFMDDELFLGADGRPVLYLQVFHPEWNDLFAAGLVQANGSIWRLAELQARLIASFLVAESRGHGKAAWFRALKAQASANPRRHGYVPSARHKLEVDYHEYTRLLKRTARRFGECARLPYVRPAGELRPEASAPAIREAAE